MTWQGVVGHDEVVERFRRAISRGRLASSFLFVGPSGIGKRRFAMRLAQALLCHTRPESAMDPCGICSACTQVQAGTHPDFQMVSKPPDKSAIPLGLLIGDPPDYPRREALCHAIGMKPMMGGRKVAVIDDADYLNVEGANSLLKTLEEPPPRSVLILLGTSPARQLPTIRSRCQLIRFRPLSEEVVAQLLLEHGLVSDAADARRLAAHSGGSVQRAVELADPALWEFRRVLFQRLAEPAIDSVRLSAALMDLVEHSGKEPAVRRARIRQVLRFAIEFYQLLVCGLTGAPLTGDQELRHATERAMAAWQGDLLLAAACLDRCLEAAEQLDRNAHQATLIEGWFDSLARMTAPGHPASGARSLRTGPA